MRGFFESGEGLSERLAERRRWLSAVPGRHAAMLPEATPMLDELVELCGEAKGLDAGGLAEVRRGGTPPWIVAWSWARGGSRIFCC